MTYSLQCSTKGETRLQQTTTAALVAVNGIMLTWPTISEYINLTWTSKESALNFSRKILLQLEKKSGLICLWALVCLENKRTENQRGKPTDRCANQTPVIVLPTNHCGIPASTFSHGTPGTYSHFCVAEVATKILHILIRLITELAALYTSATLAKQVKEN